jgi:hypothetical protein
MMWRGLTGHEVGNPYTMGLVRNPHQWQAGKKGIPGKEAPDKHLIAAPITRRGGVAERHTCKAAAQA